MIQPPEVEISSIVASMYEVTNSRPIDENRPDVQPSDQRLDSPKLPQQIGLIHHPELHFLMDSGDVQFFFEKN